MCDWKSISGLLVESFFSCACAMSRAPPVVFTLKIISMQRLFPEFMLAASTLKSRRIQLNRLSYHSVLLSR